MSKEFFQGIMSKINPPPVAMPVTPPKIGTSNVNPITVESGDTLGGLGAEHGFDWRDSQIIRDGKTYDVGYGSGEIPPEKIRPGDQIVPNGDAPTTNPIKEAEQAAEEEGSEQDVEEYCQKCAQCELVTVDMLKKVFTRAPDSRLAAIAEGINYNINTGKVDNELRLTHFFGQVREEVGPRAALEESLNYTPERLISIFTSTYGKNHALARVHGRTSAHPANQEAIANTAYANRIGNGSVESGDGWRYRGRGLKQLTGRANYKDFSQKHKDIWGEDTDFEANPDLLLKPKYAVRSALYYWVNNSLYTLADSGAADTTTDSITERINPGARGSLIRNRRAHVRNIYSAHIFQPVCFNTDSALSNSEAENPL